MEKNEKKVWVKPEIRILVKGEAEEAVLGSCKNHWAVREGGPENYDCTTLFGLWCSQDASS